MERKSQDDAQIMAFVDVPTLIGLVLLLLPTLTMAHEIGGHGAACVLLGGTVVEVGAYYVDCNSTSEMARRLVSMAGTGSDLIVFFLSYALWKRARSDLVRLAAWLAFVGKGMVATGYFLFSGLLGVGDWAPAAHGGIGPLPYPMLVRAVLAGLGLWGYIKVIRLGKVTMRQMVGGNPSAAGARRTITLGYYWTTGLAALGIGLLNPIGVFVLLASSIASSFGGNAGILSIARDRLDGPPVPFQVQRNIAIIAIGIVAVVTFALVLGPSVKLTQLPN